MTAPELFMPGRLPPGTLLLPWLKILFEIRFPFELDWFSSINCFIVTSFGLDPPPVVIFPGILQKSKNLVSNLLVVEKFLPKRLVERRGVPRHDFRPRCTSSFVENLVEDSLLLESINVVRSLWRYQ